MRNEEELAVYREDAETMEVVYELLGARPWVIEYDENGQIISTKWPKSKPETETDAADDDGSISLDDWLKRIHDLDRDRVNKAYQAMVDDKTGATSYDIEYRHIRPDGSIRWYQSVGRVIRRPDGSPLRSIGLMIDVTEKKEKMSELEEQYEIVEALSRGYLNVFMIDLDAEEVTIVKLDGYVTEGFGDKNHKCYPYTPFALKYINDRVYSEDQDELKEAMSIEMVRQRLDQTNEYVYSYRAVENGSIHFYQFTYIKLKTGSGEEKVIAGFKNIDSIVASAKERETLKLLSETDIMSNVLNRGYGEKLARDLVEAGETGLFCMLDIDRFKKINDKFGHGIGDKVIRAVADALKTTFRKSDIVFRLGGDEFVAVAAGIKDRDAANKLMERFFNYIEEIDIKEMSGYPVCVSVGAALFDGDEDFDDLYRSTDRCVYISKGQDGNEVTFA